MTLSIVIPQYRAGDAEIYYLLTSIDTQVGIDFSEIEVVIVNDGSQVHLTEAFLKSFQHISPKFILKPVNEGPGLTRQAGLDIAKGDYVMFCDEDDSYFCATALHDCLTTLKEVKPAILCTSWVKEQPYWDGAVHLDYQRAGEEWAAHHGKVYNRKFLKAYNIHFCRRARYNEDYGFNAMVTTYLNNLAALAPDLNCSTRYHSLDKVTYVWKYNAKSATRTISEDGSDFFVGHFTDFVISAHWVIDRCAEEFLQAVPAKVEQLLVNVFAYMKNNEAEFSEKNAASVLAATQEMFDKYITVRDSLSDKERHDIFNCLASNLDYSDYADWLKVRQQEFEKKNKSLINSKK